jgi:hypothetical protein
MPEYVVLKCFSCGLFQGAQRRKDNKFVCVVCRAKQSIRQIFAISEKSGDLRVVIQELNLKQGQKADALALAPPVEPLGDDDCQWENAEVDTMPMPHWQGVSHASAPAHKVSRWAAYMDDDAGDDATDFAADDIDPRFVTSLPARGRGRGGGRGNATRSSQTNVNRSTDSTRDDDVPARPVSSSVPQRTTASLLSFLAKPKVTSIPAVTVTTSVAMPRSSSSVSTSSGSASFALAPMVPALASSLKRSSDSVFAAASAPPPKVIAPGGRTSGGVDRPGIKASKWAQFVDEEDEQDVDEEDGVENQKSVDGNHGEGLSRGPVTSFATLASKRQHTAASQEAHAWAQDDSDGDT